MLNPIALGLWGVRVENNPTLIPSNLGGLTLAYKNKLI